MIKFLVICSFLLLQLEKICAEYPYCFRFTWIGPYPDKEHLDTLTCDTLRDDATNIPCRLPLVATENDTIPDTLDLWQQHRDQPDLFGCPMTPGQSCVKYTFVYKGGVQNITYMCAKVNATNGCYRQKYISGLNVEVCVCSSQAGILPCNGGSLLQQSAALLVGVTLFSMIYATWPVHVKLSGAAPSVMLLKL